MPRREKAIIDKKAPSYQDEALIGEGNTARHLDEGVIVDAETAKRFLEGTARFDRGEPVLLDAEYAKRLGFWTTHRNVGEMIRHLREGKGISLRALAAKVGVSPGYVSFLERNTIKSPPTEKLVRRIARVLEANVDEMLALAGKVSTDVVWSCAKHPRQMGVLLRGAAELQPEEIEELAKRAQEFSVLRRRKEKESSDKKTKCVK